MTKPVQFRRLLAVAILLACCFSGLAWRLVDLQVVRHEEFSARLRANTHRSYLLQARRGDIRDIHGNLLATSLPAKTICADPSLIGSHAALVARAIASFLGEDERRLAERIAPRTRTNADGAAVTNRYVVLQRRVPVETWQQIYTAMTNLTFGVDEKLLKKGERAFYRNLRNQAVFAEPVDDQIRSYPNGRLASHVLGYTSQHEVTNSLGRDFIEC
jgi:cell division protein FtsI/penicillin-binding protein 2